MAEGWRVDFELSREEGTLFKKVISRLFIERCDSKLWESTIMRVYEVERFTA
jgi:hypothetical protein